ncbi:LacI family DNA-binding transcriptional regulator [Quadrisphaera sp. INWT6]|uniref:LacI family DNA-binding transcriptional regulator n=1 Tax=Quadrisphaera sp. INWT6 TaxID=2596917 RepID=UPI0018924EC6|nr:LacI family DNA-binding transcriptional regulator [Quadrisphaera sp. INWT6]MBF5083206.1 LacI family transcriptional regulator [Quadrisphaera sp. INWT6]
MTRPPTIRDVAARAGVSKSLVSLVINGSPLVRDEKRAAVLAAVEELGFRPSATARHLTTRRTGAVGVLVTDLRNPWYADALDAVHARLHAAGATMLLGDARLDAAAEGRVLHTFVDLRLDGLVLVGSLEPTPAVLDAAQRLPTVVAGARDVDLPGVDVSVQDDDAGARLATGHLLALGHRRLAHLAGASGAVMRVREEGFEAAVAAAEGVRGEVVRTAMTEDAGYLAALELLSRSEEDRPTAVFAAADVAALGVLRAAAQCGLRVPEDLSVVGFDDVPLARLPGTALTTVDPSSAAVGATAVDLLMDRVADPGRERRVEVAPTSLVVRRTTAPPRT